MDSRVLDLLPRASAARSRHSSSIPRGRRLRSLVALLGVVAGLVLAGTGPAHASPAVWAALGPDAVVDSDGTTAAPAFHYDVADHSRTSAGWLFSTTAAQSGLLTLPWSWTGDHGRKQVRSKLTIGVYRDGAFQQIAVLLDDGPRDRAAAAFAYSGTATLNVVAGDRYGFLLTAAHTDKQASLKGSFALRGGPVLTVPTEPVTAVASAEDGATAVTFSATAQDSAGHPVPVVCDPASGSQFPIGDTDVQCTATDDNGLTASAHLTVRVFADQPNLAWTTATPLDPDDTRRGVIREPGQALWYRFPVRPDSTVELDLTELAANNDLTLFGDLGAAFEEALTVPALDRMGAEFAADAFSPSAFSPSAFSPSAFSPSAFSPSAFSPSAFSPSAFSPSAFSPSAFSPSAFSPSAFSPSAFSPSAFSPSAFSPSAFSPSAFSPSAFSPEQLRDAYSSAQVRRLITVSARDGLADESIRVSTWDATGYFYVRVTGRNGDFAPRQPFRLSVHTTGGACDSPLRTFDELATQNGTPGAARTVVLTDSSRLQGAPLATLNAFADRPEVDGVVVDAATIPRLRALNDQADEDAGCPYAKNLVAQALRGIVNSYRDQSGTLEYVVIAGDDDVVPFFRSADAAGLGPEQNYVPPVADPTPSQAALRRNQVLSQDAYGAATDVRLKGATVAVPDLAVGRLVETPQEIRGALERYQALGGALPTPRSALVTGYDFLTDSADAVAASLRAGLGSGAQTTELITDADVPPTTTTAGGAPDRRHSWTAADLRARLLGGPHRDLVYLAGHFSANSALAADYRTSLLTTEVADSAADLTNTLVVSAGCHSGYNIVDAHAVPGLTERLDWPQVMADKGAVLIAGTGYQYGDTDFVEYSERLYAGLTDQLRTGTGTVPLGAALVRAKQHYLATTPVLSGIHQKALAEATLYGLPMLTINLPGARLPGPSTATQATTPVAGGPGAVLGLRTATVRAEAPTTLVTQPFADPDGTGLSHFSYLRGRDGVVTSPGQPALPLQSLSVDAAGLSLRGVGFRGGSYADTPGVVPLTGAPATETAEVHTAFSSPVFFPRRLAQANQFGELGGDGVTRLLVTPAQHRSDGPYTSTMRRYAATDFQLFYSANTQTYGQNTPALASPPDITSATSTVTGSTVQISARVVGDPSAGIAQVWVTRTAEAGPWYGAWTSADLVQDPQDSTLWSGTLALPAGQAAGDVRYVVQAVNGVGLVTMEDNQGREFTPGVAPTQQPGTTTSTTTVSAPSRGVFGSSLPVTVSLTAGSPLPGRQVRVSLGNTSTVVTTDATGVARTSLPLVQQVGPLTLTASFDGDSTAARSADQRVVTVDKRPSQLDLSGPTQPVGRGEDTGVVATLRAGPDPVGERSVLFVARQGGAVVAAAVRTTRPDGTAALGALDLPAGTSSVRAFFGTENVEVVGGEHAGSTDPDHEASVSAPVEVRVETPPDIGTDSLPDAEAGTAYTTSVVVRGEPAPTVTVTGLPAGIGYADGSLTGTTTRAGSYAVTVTATNARGTDVAHLTLVVRPGAATTVVAVSGGGQSATFGTAFAAPLVARVTDAYGNGVAGALVTFRSPATGAGTAPPTLTAVSGSDGLASVTVTAGTTIGGYDVVASSGSATTAGFRLANAYRLTRFDAPYDVEPDAPPVSVGKYDVVVVAFRLADAAGYVTDSVGLELAGACRVRLSSAAVGSSDPGPRCMGYDLLTHQFTYRTSGLLLGWQSGTTYVVRATVTNSPATDGLGSREVRVQVR